MKEEKGSLTVEAVLIIPFLIMVSIMLVCICVYVYNRTLLVHAAEEISISVRNCSRNEDIKKICNAEYERLKSDSPFFFLENVECEIEKEGMSLYADISGSTKFPVLSSLNRIIGCRGKLVKGQPVIVMYTTEFVKRIMEDQ